MKKAVYEKEIQCSAEIVKAVSCQAVACGTKGRHECCCDSHAWDNVAFLLTGLTYYAGKSAERAIRTSHAVGVVRARSSEEAVVIGEIVK